MTQNPFYPAGVTGNEFAIAGPDREWDNSAPAEIEECPHCKTSLQGKTVTFQSYRFDVWFFCPNCEEIIDCEPIPEIGDDKDYDPDVEWERNRLLEQNLEEY